MPGIRIEHVLIFVFQDMQIMQEAKSKVSAILNSLLYFSRDL